LSQPRRRRRRRGRGRGGSGGAGGGAAAPGDAARKQQQSPGGQNQGQPPQGTGKRSRRRRGRGRGQQRQASPKSSEDLVRATPKERPSTLTAPADGQTLEGIIGELQSVWGVPQYPQEYRITIKVAEEKDQRADTSGDDNGRADAPARANGDGPRREKAPAAPLMRMRGEGGDQPSEGSPRKHRRGRRRRRGGGGGGGPAPSGGS
jgi:hypothetical protein